MRTLSARTFSKFFGGKISPNLHSVSPRNMFAENKLKGVHYKQVYPTTINAVFCTRYYEDNRKISFARIKEESNIKETRAIKWSPLKLTKNLAKP